MKKEKKIEILKKYLSENDVVIVDKSHASKNRLAKTLLGFGSPKEKIHLCSEFEQAKQIAISTKSSLILCDYYIENGNGFDLFRAIKNPSEAPTPHICILITSNLSQAAVAKAAEEDVDTFILKPYTVNILLDNLAETISNKLYPSDYVQKIEEGKKLLEEGKTEEANELFKSAQGLNEKPALAHFYKGHVHGIAQSNDEAIEEYQQGLSFNHIHFKCQNGLFQSYLAKGQDLEAYKVAKELVKYYPANHERFKTIIKLAITTENLNDFDFLYELFSSSEEKDEKLINHMCAGMFVVAKYFLIKEEPSKALNYFKKIASSFGKFYKFPKAIIETLVDFQMHNEANEYISLFPEDLKKDNYYILSEFLVKSYKVDDESFTTQGEELVKSGIQSYVLHKLLAKKFYKLNNQTRAEVYLSQAKEFWPEKEEELNSVKEVYSQKQNEQAA